MKSLRRYHILDAYYFVTAVTYRREPLLLRDVDLFWVSWRNRELTAWVILPDHFHAILQPINQSISNIIHQFKITYSRHFRDKYRAGRVWQNRFWDHVIRGQEDLHKHINYIHYNPVKHGLAKDAQSYLLSSFQKFVTKGYYSLDWGSKAIEFEGEYGE
jgi:putative transposase